MKIKQSIFALLLIINFSSCGYIFERLIFSRPYNKKFIYYTRDKNPIINDKLNTETFYYNISNNDVYTYLGFKDDGTVITFSNTGMEPAETNSLEMMNPPRKRNKTPKDITDDYGFYETVGDSIFISYLTVGLGSNYWFYLKGTIKNGQLILTGKRVSANIPEHISILQTQTYNLYKN